MTSPTLPSVGDKYLLPTGKEDASRLDVVHAVYGPISLRGLEAASIEAATRAVDVGCGTGTVSRWMAAKMGASGRVDAIDMAPEQIEVAKAAPFDVGSGAIHFQVGSAYSPDLPEDSYDVVFCRVVLCHLKEPQKAVEQMVRLLRPGGRLVLVDVDVRDIFAMPPCHFYQSYIEECVIPYQTKIGVDYSVGRRLPEFMSRAGLKTDFVVADQPIFPDGPEKHVWEQTFEVALPRTVSEGVISMDRGKELIAGMKRHTASPDVWVAVAKIFAAIGSK